MIADIAKKNRWQIMSDLMAKLRQVEIETSGEMGSYHLFALFLKDYGFNNWDIMIAAPWIKKNNKWEISRYINEKIRAALDLEERLRLTAVKIIENDHYDLMDALEQLGHVEHGYKRCYSRILFGEDVAQIYVITARWEEVAS